MKEITFEELIIQLFPNHELTKDMWSFELMQFSADDLIEFGKQVREATIAECVEILKNPNIPKSRMESLPTKIHTTTPINYTHC